MKKVTFSDTDEVREYNTEDTPADPLPPDPAQQTLAGKRGRPPKPVELLSPLQLSEKRMKTAEETYHGEKYALFAKVIELKDSHAWLGHPSVVARLDERLDNRCQGVVELQLEAEAAERSWECERKKDAEAQCGGPDCQRACAVVDRHFVSFKIFESCKRKNVLSEPNVCPVRS